MTTKDILKIVEDEIDKRQPKTFHLQVQAEGIRHEGNWWFIVVRPDKAGIRAFDYNNVLRAAENSIEKSNNLNVLLVPMAV